MKSAGVWLLLGFVRCYQVFLGPFFGGACKFYPSCSKYAYEAIGRHGARRGFVLAMKRLGRCRPFARGGYDPVPDAGEFEAPAGRIHARAGMPGEPFLKTTQEPQERAQ